MSAAADLTRNVKVGDREYTVARFRGLKAQRVLRISASIGRKYPAITQKVSEFEQQYSEDNALTLGRPEAELRYGVKAAEISEEAWSSADGELKMKPLPDTWERLGAVWPELIEVAEAEIFELLSVLSLTNEELATADDEDKLDEAIATRRKEILHNGDLEEIFELAKAGYEVARGQFAPLVAMVGPVLEALGLTMGEREPTESSTSSEAGKTTPSPPSSD